MSDISRTRIRNKFLRIYLSLESLFCVIFHMSRRSPKHIEQKWGKRVYRVIRTEKKDMMLIAVWIIAISMALNTCFNMYFAFICNL